MIRTGTIPDQDNVLIATVQVCTACMDVSLLTTGVNFNTPPLKVLKLQSVATAHVPSQPGPEKASAHRVILAHHWALD